MFALSRRLAHRKNASRKQPNRRFIPQDVLGKPMLRLEDRALAAPAFWRFPLGSLQDATSWVTATAQAVQGQTNGMGDMNYAAASETNTVPTSTLNIISTSEIPDLPDPAPPTAPVGNYSISFGVTSEVDWMGSQADGNGGAARTTGFRQYQIATDGGSTTGWSVFEHVNLIYSAPTSLEISAQFLMMATNVATPGINLAAGGANTLGAFIINGTQIAAGASGSIINSGTGQVIHFTSTPASIDIMAWTPQGALNVANTNPVVGNAWNVQYTTDLGMQALPMLGVTHLKADLTVSYSAGFVRTSLNPTS